MGGISPLIDSARAPKETPQSLVKMPAAPKFGEDDVGTMEGILSIGRGRLANLQTQQANVTTKQQSFETQLSNLTAQKLAYDRQKEEFGAKQREEEARSNYDNIKKMFDDEVNSPGFKEKQRINKEIAEYSVFVPTEVTAPMLGVLFSAIGAAGMLLGGNSKNTAKAALSAMNGMAEGFGKGREQYDKERKQAFDSNLKLLQSKLTAVKDGLEDARREAVLNKQAADQKVRETLAANEAQFLQENTNKRGLESTIALVDGQLKSLKHAAELLSTKTNQLSSELQREALQVFLKRADIKSRESEGELNRQIRKEIAQSQLASQAESRALRSQLARDSQGAVQPIGMADGKMVVMDKFGNSRIVDVPEGFVGKGSLGAGEKLSATREKKIDGLNSITSGLDKLKKDFKPEYAGLGVFGFGADLELEAARRGLGKKEANDAARWWGRYNQYQAPNRHALFGATLTGNELKNYQSFTAKPSDSAQTVRGFIDDQINYSKDILDVTAPAGYKPKAKPEDYESTFGAPSPAPQPSASQPSTGPYIDPDKERRYQDWKSRQPK